MTLKDKILKQICALSAPLIYLLIIERGVLIGYVLCNKCAKHIFRATKKNPYQETPLHAEIEKNLVEGYKRYLAKMNNA